MAVNKRACRKYIDPGLVISPSSGLLCMKQVRYIVRTAVKNIAGKRLLLLYFYDRERAARGEYIPAYTLFQAKDDYITWEQPAAGKGKWRTAGLENMGDYYNRFGKISAFYSPRDEQRVTRFCDVPDLVGFEALEYRQQRIMDGRLKKRIIAREQKIVQRMQSVPAVPRDLKGFIHREVLPAYIFYRYRKSKKPMAGYCSACGHDVSVSEPRHNQSGLCPRCKRAVTFKAAGLIKTLYDQATAQVVQKIGGDELLVRIFKTVKSYKANYRAPHFSVWENARFFVRRTDDGVEVFPYYYSFSKGILTRWQKGERPVMSQWHTGFEADTCGHLYHRNLETVLAGTAWEYSQVKAFYLKDREPLELLPYLYGYLRYPVIEYLVKLGLTGLAASAVYKHNSSKAFRPNGGNLREVLGVSPQDIPVLQEVNADVKQLELVQALRKHHIRFDAELLRWYKASSIGFAEDLLFALRFTTPLKLMRYIDGQYDRLKDITINFGHRRYENPGRVFSEYKDYLGLADLLKYDLKNSFVLFPRNVQRAHDQANKLYENRKKEIQDKAVQSAYAALRERYGFTDKGLTVLPPKTADEIVAEGHALHHCVGSYVDHVVDGKSIILFLRQADDPQKPFYTIELRGGEIAQTRGQNNRGATREVQKCLNRFERKVLRAANTQKAA